MTEIGIVLDICVTLFALLAAFFWFKSSKVHIPDFKEIATMAGFGGNDDAPSTKYFKNVSKLNAKAASCAGASALAAVASIVIGYFS